MRKSNKSNVNQVKSSRPAGRPVSNQIVGYKLKVGLRYAKRTGPMVEDMSEGDVFPTLQAAATRLQEYAEAGEVRPHNRGYPVKFIIDKGLMKNKSKKVLTSEPECLVSLL